MRTTLQIPDEVLHRAKAKAAERGIPLRQFVTEAMAEKLSVPALAGKPWLTSFGQLRHLHAETVRINKVIAEEFEQIEPEDTE